MLEGTKVNLNKADKSELAIVEGIGEATAESIIKYREEHGGFRNFQELRNIPNIDEEARKLIQEQTEL